MIKKYLEKDENIIAKIICWCSSIIFVWDAVTKLKKTLKMIK